MTGQARGEPALVSITRGQPTEEELAALLAVLQACAPRPRPRADPGRGGWTPGTRSRPWQGPVSWSPGPRDWTSAR